MSNEHRIICTTFKTVFNRISEAERGRGPGEDPGQGHIKDEGPAAEPKFRRRTDSPHLHRRRRRRKNRRRRHNIQEGDSDSRNNNRICHK